MAYYAFILSILPTHRWPKRRTFAHVDDSLLGRVLLSIFNNASYYESKLTTTSGYLPIYPSDLINDIKYDYGASVSAFEPRGFTVPQGIITLSNRREDIAAYNIDLGERLSDVKQAINA